VKLQSYLILYLAASCSFTAVRSQDAELLVLHREEEKHQKLSIDTATVTVTSKIAFKTSLLSQSDDCWKVCTPPITAFVCHHKSVIYLHYISNTDRGKQSDRYAFVPR